MITKQQLAKHIADNNLNEQQALSLLDRFSLLVMEDSIKNAFNKVFMIRRKVKWAREKRLKKEFDKILTSLRDEILTKN